MNYDLKKKGYDPSLARNGARKEARQYQSANARRRKEDEGFFGQSFELRNFIIAPEGFEHIVFGIYFLLFPYLAGLAFLYLFIAEGNFEFFIEFDIMSFFIVWSIGYEVIAGSILAFIVLKWISHLGKKKEEPHKKGHKGRF